MKKLITIAVILLVVAAAAAGAYYYSRKGPEPRINTAQVSRGDVIQSVGATGTLEAVRTFTVGSQVSGIVQNLYADFNSIVKKGQLIAKLDPSLMQTQRQAGMRTLNDSLGSTSVVVTYDVPEAVKLADYLYVMGDGRIVGHGPTQAMLDSQDPYVRQFLHAQPDGPVPFHFPARPIAEELDLAPARRPAPLIHAR